ncbi:LacI family DNA-binding transcriptional regulator [Tahibacter soli]
MKRKDKEQASGGRLTMSDLAGLAGVSKITVSRALGDSPYVNAATRERVRALAAEHGYKLNISARNLRLRQSHTIAVIVEMTPSAGRPMSDPYPLELLGGITQELTTLGYSLLLTTRQGAGAPAVQAADGVILLGQGAHQDAVHLFDRLQLPMVVWGAAPTDAAHVVVGSDNRQGGSLAAERFLALARRHPVFLGDPDHPEPAERLAGFRAALAARRIEPRVARRTEWTLEAGMQTVQALIRDKIHFDAIFACNDLLAMGAVRALIEHGLRVPEDVSVIGYDDTPLAAAFIPPLSSVHQNWREGGALLARKVLALTRGEDAASETLASALVVRGT